MPILHICFFMIRNAKKKTAMQKESERAYYLNTVKHFISRDRYFAKLPLIISWIYEFKIKIFLCMFVFTELIFSRV